MKSPAMLSLLALALISAGCANGQKLSHAEAQEWVTANRTELMALVETLNACDGRQDNRFNRIFVDGGDFTNHCDNQRRTILQQLKSLDIAAVAYSPVPDQTTRPWVEFGLYLSGMVTSGTSISVTWFAEPSQCESEEISEAGYEYLKTPLFDGDCHWMFESEST